MRESPEVIIPRGFNDLLITNNTAKNTIISTINKTWIIFCCWTRPSFSCSFQESNILSMDVNKMFLSFCKLLRAISNSGESIDLSSRVTTLNWTDSHNGSNLLSDSEFSLGSSITNSGFSPMLSKSKPSVGICNKVLIPNSNEILSLLRSSWTPSPSPIEISKAFWPMLCANSWSSMAISLCLLKFLSNSTRSSCNASVSKINSPFFSKT